MARLRLVLGSCARLVLGSFLPVEIAMESMRLFGLKIEHMKKVVVEVETLRFELRS